LGASIKSSLAGIAAGITVGLFVNAAKSALEYAGHLGELADTLGITTKDLQTFSYAAGQVGISQDELQVGIQKLTISMGQAQLGAKKQAEAFKAIGISLADIKGKDTGEVFRQIADRLQNVGDRSQRAAVEVALFGKAGAKLDNLLSGAQGRLSELSDAAEKLGIVLSDDQIQHADETADKLEALKTVLKAQLAGVVSDNAGAILQFANALGYLISKIGEAIKGYKILNAEFSAPLKLGENPFHTMNVAGRAERFHQFLDEKYPNAGQGRIKTTGGADIGHFLAGAGPKPKKDHSAEELERKQLDAQRKLYDFQQDELRAQEDILNARKDLSTDYIEQGQLQLQILDIQRAQYQAELANQVAENRITKGKDGITEAQAAQKQALYDQADSLKRQAVTNQVEEERQRKYEEFQQQFFDTQQARLEAEASLATTASARRKVELEILDLAYQEKRERLERIAKESLDADERIKAEEALGNLSVQYKLDRANVMQQTRNPLEEWAASIPKTRDEIIAAMQQIEAQGIDSLADSLTEVLMGTKSLKSAFHDLAASILADLIKMTIKMLLFKALQQAIGGHADGGPIGISSGFATGGFVRGPGSSRSDSIPAMLSNGEFVVNAKATKAFLPLLKSINEGAFRFAQGGMVIPRPSFSGRLSAPANDAAPFSVTMHNDFRGADPSSVARIENHLNDLERRLPGQIVSTMNDARDRFLWRNR
jgi:hypothetical protein